MDAKAAQATEIAKEQALKKTIEGYKAAEVKLFSEYKNIVKTDGATLEKQGLVMLSNYTYSKQVLALANLEKDRENRPIVAVVEKPDELEVMTQ